MKTSGKAGNWSPNILLFLFIATAGRVVRRPLAVSSLAAKRRRKRKRKRQKIEAKKFNRRKGRKRRGNRGKKMGAKRWGVQPQSREETQRWRKELFMPVNATHLTMTLRWGTGFGCWRGWRFATASAGSLRVRPFAKFPRWTEWEIVNQLH